MDKKMCIRDRVYCAQIESQEYEDSKIDWRRGKSFLKHIKHELPNAIKEKCIEMTKKLGLKYSAIDLILDNTGKYIFLECNPNGPVSYTHLSGDICCSCTKSEPGKLVVNLEPDTMIYALNVYNKENETGDYWYQIYAGPLKMEFDFEAIRDARNRLKYTQKQVADAIGASVRTLSLIHI